MDLSSSSTIIGVSGLYDHRMGGLRNCLTGRRSLYRLLAVFDDSITLGIRFLPAHIRPFIGRPVPPFSI
jgi:hypothetical protein